jgi:diphthine-ammonia ligase
MRSAAILWTGGKDSALALDEARRAGYDVRCLVTFAPPDPDFLAHPLSFMKLQAGALGLPHRVLPVVAPFETGYETGLRGLRDELGIECVVTGDVAEVDGTPNWIRERCRPVGMEAFTPLWARDREGLLQQLLDRGFRARFSCVDTRRLDESWVGRDLNAAAIAELRIVRERTGLDLCGEQGEYHTLVVDGPPFAQAIEIRSWSKRIVDSRATMEIHHSELTGRTARG